MNLTLPSILNRATPPSRPAPATDLSGLFRIAEHALNPVADKPAFEPPVVEVAPGAPAVAPAAPAVAAAVHAVAAAVAPVALTSSPVTQPRLPSQPQPEGEKKTVIRWLSAIHEFSIAGEWTREKDKAAGDAARAALHQYSLQEDKHVRLCFFNRGNRLSKATSDAFRAVLASPAHLLDAFERHALREVLRDKAGEHDFTFTSIRTADHKGKKVLLVEGTYNKWGLKALTMYVDSSRYKELGSVQEISYLCPKQSYYQYYSTVIRAMQNIVWKS